MSHEIITNMIDRGVIEKLLTTDTDTWTPEVKEAFHELALSVDRQNILKRHIESQSAQEWIQEEVSNQMVLDTDAAMMGGAVPERQFTVGDDGYFTFTNNNPTQLDADKHELDDDDKL